MQISFDRLPSVIAMLGIAAVCLTVNAQDGQKAAPKAGVDEDFPVKMDAVAEKRGADGKQRLTITLSLDKDFYVFANPPGHEEFISAKTTLQVTGKNPPQSVDITYPKGEEKKVEGLGTLKIYTGKVQIEAVVQRAAGDSEPLLVTVKLQPFNARTMQCRWWPTALKQTVK
jgi:hypothetical protein